MDTQSSATASSTIVTNVQCLRRYRPPRKNTAIDASGRCSMSPKCLKRVAIITAISTSHRALKREPESAFTT